MRITWYILILISLSGCYTRKEAIDKFGCKTIQSKDSFIYLEKVRLDTISIPQDTISIQIPCDTIIRYQKIKSGRATIEVVPKEGGKGYVIRANCDSIQKILLSKEVEIRRIKEATIKQPQTGIKVFIEWAKNLFAVVGVIYTLYLLFIGIRNYRNG